MFLSLHRHQTQPSSSSASSDLTGGQRDLLRYPENSCPLSSVTNTDAPPPPPPPPSSSSSSSSFRPLLPK
ncbi:hypothetical protein INR49_000174 [Caranx melampygus]|nr:hypothetical protein INR49_000174 [Caranx melampygus]